MTKRIVVSSQDIYEMSARQLNWKQVQMRSQMSTQTSARSHLIDVLVR